MIKNRKLDIGPGEYPIKGFETLDLIDRGNTTHIVDATKKLPFEDNTFQIIHASHILEHVPWYDVQDVLKEWVRILELGGQLEIWVPDGYKICQAVIDYENDIPFYHYDNWFYLNPKKDFYLWVAGRMFGHGKKNEKEMPMYWHKSFFTPKSLFNCLDQAGLKNIVRMGKKDLRGHNHGWTNLGMKGTK